MGFSVGVMAWATGKHGRSRSIGTRWCGVLGTEWCGRAFGLALLVSTRRNGRQALDGGVVKHIAHRRRCRPSSGGGAAGVAR
jgi:hypothetical protein